MSLPEVPKKAQRLESIVVRWLLLSVVFIVIQNGCHLPSAFCSSPLLMAR